MTDPEVLLDRRAIEALRSGVPNRDAVRALGTTQPHVEEKFRQQLERALDDLPNQTQTAGLLIGGDFGSGKSHLLEHLQHLALDERFVCSKVVISKETPLYDAAKLFRAAIQAAVVPGRRGFALTEIAFSLKLDSRGFVELSDWANDPKSDLDPRFAATLFLFERVRDEEVRDRIIAFWSGDPLNTVELRRWLREHGEAATYKLDKVATKDLPLHRFRFVPRLMAAAGYSGWVLLVDEVELIGRYSFRQRARSYAELARWAGKLPHTTYSGLTSVFAITVDFARAVLEDKNDKERIPGRLRATERDTDGVLAGQAERGMRLIDREVVRLRAPDAQTIARTRERVREMHGRAYGWEPPPPGPDEQLGSTSMRQYIRRWITEWDLRRLYPDYEARTVVSDLAMDYSEDPNLEVQSEGDPGLA